MESETTYRTESVRVPHLRASQGNLWPLAASIRDEGMRHPVTVWKDGTIISGGRRLRAHFLIEKWDIQAVTVDTVEDAAKRLLSDNQDAHLSEPYKPSETCRLIELLRRLDGPAAVVRADANRRRGVELRRQTQAGQREQGRVGPQHSYDHVLTVTAEAVGMSETSAKRLWSVYSYAYGTAEASDEKREQARAELAAIDAGDSTIWASYQRLMSGRPTPIPRTRAAIPATSAPAARQIAAWERALPQLEGLTTGLIELGKPSPELTWDQVGPVHARLKLVRRELEKMINQMKESSKP